MATPNRWFATITKRDTPDTTEFDRGATPDEAITGLRELGWPLDLQAEDLDNGGYLILLPEEVEAELLVKREVTRHMLGDTMTVTIDCGEAF